MGSSMWKVLQELMGLLSLAQKLVPVFELDAAFLAVLAVHVKKQRRGQRCCVKLLRSWFRIIPFLL